MHVSLFSNVYLLTQLVVMSDLISFLVYMSLANLVSTQFDFYLQIYKSTLNSHPKRCSNVVSSLFIYLIGFILPSSIPSVIYKS